MRINFNKHVFLRLLKFFFWVFIFVSLFSYMFIINPFFYDHYFSLFFPTNSTLFFYSLIRVHNYILELLFLIVIVVTWCLVGILRSYYWGNWIITRGIFFRNIFFKALINFYELLFINFSIFIFNLSFTFFVFFFLFVSSLINFSGYRDTYVYKSFFSKNFIIKFFSKVSIKNFYWKKFFFITGPTVFYRGYFFTVNLNNNDFKNFMENSNIDLFISEQTFEKIYHRNILEKFFFGRVVSDVLSTNDTKTKPFFVQKFLHNNKVELTWAFLPTIICVTILLPSLILLYSSVVLKSFDNSHNFTGHQWFWNYQALTEFRVDFLKSTLIIDSHFWTDIYFGNNLRNLQMPLIIEHFSGQLPIEKSLLSSDSFELSSFNLEDKLFLLNFSNKLVNLNVFRHVGFVFNKFHGANHFFEQMTYWPENISNKNDFISFLVNTNDISVDKLNFILKSNDISFIQKELLTLNLSANTIVNLMFFFNWPFPKNFSFEDFLKFSYLLSQFNKESILFDYWFSFQFFCINKFFYKDLYHVLPGDAPNFFFNIFNDYTISCLEDRYDNNPIFHGYNFYLLDTFRNAFVYDVFFNGLSYKFIYSDTDVPVAPWELISLCEYFFYHEFTKIFFQHKISAYFNINVNSASSIFRLKSYSIVYRLYVDAFLVDERDMSSFQSRLMDTDSHFVIPYLFNHSLHINSKDVLHSFTILTSGFKMDAVLGRLNEMQVIIIRKSVYFGQCSELCGSGHSAMPIVIECVNIFLYNSYLSEEVWEKFLKNPTNLNELNPLQAFTEISLIETKISIIIKSN